MASASSTTARSPASPASTSSQVAAPTPTPGPIASALSRASVRNRASSSGPSTGRIMTARFVAALTASASRGLAIVTSPAPARRAPRAASRAAPVDHEGPETTTAWPRSYLCPAELRHRKAFAPERGEVLGGLRRDLRQHGCGNSDVGNRDRATVDASRQKEMPGLLAKERYSPRGFDGSPHDGARRAADTARQIDRQDRGRLRIHPFDHGTRQAVDWPIEASAEQGVDHQVEGIPGAASPSGSAGVSEPPHLLAASAASPLIRSASPTSNTRTR